MSARASCCRKQRRRQCRTLPSATTEPVGPTKKPGAVHRAFLWVFHRRGSDPQAAVQLEDPAGIIVVLEDIGRRVSDFFRLAHALERDAGGHFLQGFGFHAQGHFGFDEARCDAGHANAVARQLLGPGHGRCGDPGLGGGVVGLAYIAGTGDRGNIDDRAAGFQLDHLRRDFAGAEEYAGEVDVDHRLPLGQAHLGHFAVLDLEQQAVAQDAGVIDQAVNGAEVCGDLGDHVFHLLFIGDVAQVGAGLDSRGLAGGNGLVELFLVQVDQRQPGAFAGEILRHGAAQTLATAGDNDYFVIELHSHAPKAELEWCPLRRLSCASGMAWLQIENCPDGVAGTLLQTPVRFRRILYKES
ncbi:hypothetical protein EMIT048CA2_250084 [Pseudomonas chlororaphis]